MIRGGMLPEPKVIWEQTVDENGAVVLFGCNSSIGKPGPGPGPKATEYNTNTKAFVAEDLRAKLQTQTVQAAELRTYLSLLDESFVDLEVVILKKSELDSVTSDGNSS